MTLDTMLRFLIGYVQTIKRDRMKISNKLYIYQNESLISKSDII